VVKLALPERSGEFPLTLDLRRPYGR
jgi:hypothetical protein